MLPGDGHCMEASETDLTPTQEAESSERGCAVISLYWQLVWSDVKRIQGKFVGR